MELIALVRSRGNWINFSLPMFKSTREENSEFCLKKGKKIHCRTRLAEEKNVIIDGS